MSQCYVRNYRLFEDVRQRRRIYVRTGRSRRTLYWWWRRVVWRGAISCKATAEPLSAIGPRRPRRGLLLLWRRFAGSVAVTLTSTPSSCSWHFFKVKAGRHSARVFDVSGAHRRAVLVDHVRLQVQGGTEDYEFASLAFRLVTWVVVVVEVLLLHDRQ